MAAENPGHHNTSDIEALIGIRGGGKSSGSARTASEVMKLI